MALIIVFIFVTKTSNANAIHRDALRCYYNVAKSRQTDGSCRTPKTGGQIRRAMTTVPRARGCCNGMRQSIRKDYELPDGRGSKISKVVPGVRSVSCWRHPPWDAMICAAVGKPKPEAPGLVVINS